MQVDSYNNANISVTQDVSDFVKEHLEYNPYTGDLIWKKRYSKYSNCKVGDKTGSLTSKGAYKMQILKKYFMSHRICWFLYYGVWPETFIDPINNNPADNRICNLRLANRSQNCANRTPAKGKSSRFLGVCFDKHSKKWQAVIGSNRTYLGQFLLEADAALAYNKAAKELYGEFAKLNEVN